MEIILDTTEKTLLLPIRITFTRIQFNEDGTYILNKDHFAKVLYNCHLHMELSSRRNIEQITKLPQGPVIPNATEYDVLVHYLNNNYPTVLGHCPNFILNTIREAKIRHNNLVALVKQNAREYIH